MLTPNLLRYLIEAPSFSQALKTLRYAEETGFPTDYERLPALLTAMFARERNAFAGIPLYVHQPPDDWHSGGVAS